MRPLTSTELGVLFAINALAASPPDYEPLKADAEKLFAQGSFAKAHELYRQVTLSNLPAAEQRWVQFRVADTQWRAEAATQRADASKLDQAREALEKLLRDVKREEERDRVWVEVQESLGDFWWTRRGQQNWGAAWPHYQAALDWWAGARDIELARERYLAIVWRCAQPPGMARGLGYGYLGNQLPLEVLDNALKIARSDNDTARAHYLLATTIRNQGGDWPRHARVPEHFEGALKLGKSTDWYDDALYHYAEWMLGQGRVVPLADGNWRAEPDYPKALELFRRLVSEFKEGETRYWRQAQQQIKNITEPQLGVSVPHIFLPGSEIEYHLNWRNVPKIELAFYATDLTRDVDLSRLDEKRRTDWLTSIDLGKLQRVKSWTHDARSRGRVPAETESPESHRRLTSAATGEEDYKPGSAVLRLDEKLKPGAYVLEAKAGDMEARELILVTDAALVLKTSGKQALVYFCSALHSAPIPNAKVRLWERWQDGNRWHARDHTKQTGADGIAVFDLSARPDRGLELFVSATAGDRQAFSPGNSYWHRAEQESWRIYAFTDRPAYRPKETVNWKFIARRYNGSVYSTPANAVIEFEITDPRGAKVKVDKATLNAFGSAWGALELTEAMPLGEYQIQFWDEGRKKHIGGATLFRLEEYKLPEFKVTVQTPEEDGKRKAFRLGETVEVAVQADYYFGGPVANASVEVLVRQNPLWLTWRKPRDFPWFYEDMDNGPGRFGRWYGGGQIVKRETLKTDATGKATLTFETPANANQDFEYRIEARVTDASRREITGGGSVRVTRQRYYVYPQAEHNLYRPQDKVRVDFRALDANEQPVVTKGTVKVTRDYWWEIWVKPDGTEVQGDELKALQARHKIWPPPPERPDQKDWRLKFRGYRHDDILTQTLETDAEGNATLTFTPEREGYYRVAWVGKEQRAAGILPAGQTEQNSPASRMLAARSIRAETTVWVARNATADLGYRHGGVEIIADKDTFRVGSEAPVMLVANSPDRYVLFTIEGEDLYHYRLVHLTGTVKLLDLFVEEKYVPNVFLSAAMVADRQIFTDTKQVIVPPTKNFLTVEVKSDKTQYQPRDEGTLTVTTKNDEGKPVSAEVSLGLVDESVFYIQSDYAGDPRQFFFGEKREHEIQTQATMNQKTYAKLAKDEDKRLQDRTEANELEGDYAGARYKRSAWGTASPGSRALGEVADISFAQSAIAPAAAPAPMALGAEDKARRATAEMPAGGEEPAVQVRTDFRSTVLWQPDVKTDANGKATVKVKYPDSLTGWKATARAVSQANQFGIASASTRTKQPLIVRLQAPRFFVVGDTVTISAVVNNNTDEAMEVRLSLDLGGTGSTPSRPTGSSAPPISLLEEKSKDAVRRVSPNGEARVDWTCAVKRPGEVKLKVTARGGRHADAMEKTYVAYEHGIEKFIAKSGKVRGNDITVKLDLPRERKAESTSLTVQVTPSLAVTMLDALPYLADYPYGCTEQTMSRFLPAVITAKTLRDVGLDPEDVMGRVFGGIERRAAGLPPAGQTNSPSGKMPEARSLAELDKMVAAGLDRLYDFLHADGGWGWWKEGESDHWMTAYVVWGLTLAKDAGVKIKPDVLQRATGFLDKRLVEQEDNPDMQAFMLHALAAAHASAKKSQPTEFQAKAFANLWSKRERLNAYTRALLALSAHYLGKPQEAKTLIANLENGVKRDERPDTSVLIGGQPDNAGVMGTAHWGEDGLWWRWSEGGVEATAFALRALLAVDPQNKLIEPVANWLIKNRRGAQWSNTRDTAIVVLALNDYLRVSGELQRAAGILPADQKDGPSGRMPEARSLVLEYELIVNGKSIAKRKVSGTDVFRAPSRFVVDPTDLTDRPDQPEVRIVRHSGNAPIYFAVEAKFFSLEEPITPAGNELFVKREYFKLVGRPTLLKGYVYDREPLRDGESVKSGERVETVLTIEAKNHYEYLVFEDLKPAGFEAVEVRSGQALYARELKSSGVEGSDRSDRSDRSDGSYTGRSRWVYEELRDRKVALFVDKLPEGVWQIRYDVRAEVPGTFHALPVLGHAMYVPEIRGNSAEVRLRVQESQ